MTPLLMAAVAQHSARESWRWARRRPAWGPTRESDAVTDCPRAQKPVATGFLRRLVNYEACSTACFLINYIALHAAPPIILFHAPQGYLSPH